VSNNSSTKFSVVTNSYSLSAYALGIIASVAYFFNSIEVAYTACAAAIVSLLVGLWINLFPHASKSGNRAARIEKNIDSSIAKNDVGPDASISENERSSIKENILR
jgi:hypothetical protein